MMKQSLVLLLVGATLLPCRAGAQRVLTLDECKQMAVDNNSSLKTAKQNVEIAGYDQKIARANFFPKVTAMGTWQYSSKDLQLISDDQKTALANYGTAAQQSLGEQMTAILSDPTIYMKVMSDPALQKLLGYAKNLDIATPINAIGTELGNALSLDTQHITAGIVSVQQPVFMGGKILASNKMADLALELAKTQYSQEESQINVDIESAYWQIVSIAAKKRLAEQYAELLHQMEKDTEALIAEGFATKSDQLNVQVKANEADMLLTKATNGLSLSKMLLCKECGLPLDSDIVLADENIEKMPVPEMVPEISDEEVYEARPEIKSLNLANEIYDKKVDIARADMLPTIALTGNFIVSNPSCFNGFEKKFGNMYTAGVMVSVPIFHGTEALQKTRKAKAEAVLYQIKLDDAKEMISLQVSQQRKLENEAREKLVTAEKNLAHAEENLRVANIGWESGVTTSSTLMQAQTAWLQANSEYIETSVELQMCSVNRAKAEGRL